MTNKLITEWRDDIHLAGEPQDVSWYMSEVSEEETVFVAKEVDVDYQEDSDG